MDDNTNKVDPVNKCDVCNDKLAEYYNITYYVHICSQECWDKFIKGYNREIDEIAIEITNANDLGEDNVK